MHVQRMKLLVLLSFVVLGGCTKVYPDTTAGAGTYNPASGWLSWAYPVPLERSYQATLAALEGLDLRVQTKTLDGLEGRIKAIRADRTSEVQVKVGTFGDQEQAELIHKNIRTQLRL